MGWFARLMGLEVRRREPEPSSGASGSAFVGVPASAGLILGCGVAAGVAVMNACSEEVPAAPQKTAEELEIEAIIAAADAKLAEFEAADEADRLAAREYVAPVRVKAYASGPWLSVDSVPHPAAVAATGAKPGTIEVPLIGVAEVNAQPGYPPMRTPQSQGQYVIYQFQTQGAAKAVNSPVPAAYGSVMIKTHSGQNYWVRCQRHVVDMLYAAVMQAWKTGKGTDEHER